MIQDYFGEVSGQDCGVCDVCIDKRKKDNFSAFEEIRKEVVTIVSKKLITVEGLEELIAPRDHELFVDVVREMVDDGKLLYDDSWKLNLGKA